MLHNHEIQNDEVIFLSFHLLYDLDLFYALRQQEDIPHIDNELWSRLFSGEEDRYIKIRNKLIHGGSQSSIKFESILNREFIEKVILDIVKFAYKIDLTVVDKYSSDEFPNLFMI